MESQLSHSKNDDCNDAQKDVQSTTNKQIIFATTNPVGIQVYLDDDTLQEHIAGTDGHHPERGYLLNPKNLEIIRNVVSNPTYIMNDKMYDNRYNYVDIAALDGHTTLKNIKVVTEKNSDETEKIVTIFPTKSLNEKLEGRIIYDRHSKS